jgi:hypothetical protein
MEPLHHMERTSHTCGSPAWPGSRNLERCTPQEPLVIPLILVVLVLAVLLSGGWGYSRYGTAGGIGPVGLFLLILLGLYLTGNLHV